MELVQLDEARLLQLAKTGDSEAFAHLYDACFDRVYRFVYFRILDAGLAEDITSQVFLKAWENLDRFKAGSSPFIAWLYTIAKNLVIDHHRMHKELLPLERIASLPSGLQTPDEEAQARFELQAIQDAFQILSHDQQQVLTLKYMAELPNEDIAKIMNKQEGTIRGLKMRALQALARYMEEKELL